MPFGARKNIGLYLGIVLFIVGILGLLNEVNILKFKIPLSVNVLAWILAAGGLYLIIESYTELGAKRTIALLFAFVVLVVALLPILNQLGIIRFTIPGNLLFYHILLTIEGVLLMINAFGT